MEMDLKNHPHPSLSLTPLEVGVTSPHYVRWTLKPLTPAPYPSTYSSRCVYPFATQTFSSILPSAIFPSEGSSSRD